VVHLVCQVHQEVQVQVVHQAVQELLVVVGHLELVV
jgi:hypothetical protein